MFAGGTQIESTPPGKPVRAGFDVPSGPPMARIEIGQEPQEPAGRCGDLTGEPANFPLDPLQWQTFRLVLGAVMQINCAVTHHVSSPSVVDARTLDGGCDSRARVIHRAPDGRIE